LPDKLLTLHVLQTSEKCSVNRTKSKPVAHDENESAPKVFFSLNMRFTTYEYIIRQ